MSYDSESSPLSLCSASLMKKTILWPRGTTLVPVFTFLQRAFKRCSEPCVTKIYSYPAKLCHTIYTRVLAKDIVKKECKQ